MCCVFMTYCSGNLGQKPSGEEVKRRQEPNQVQLVTEIKPWAKVNKYSID